MDEPWKQLTPEQTAYVMETVRLEGRLRDCHKALEELDKETVFVTAVLTNSPECHVIGNLDKGTVEDIMDTLICDLEVKAVQLQHALNQRRKA